jgi:hypothetical protein
MIIYTLLTFYPEERRHCAHRLGGWMGHRGGQMFWRKAKFILVTGIETHKFRN